MAISQRAQDLLTPFSA